jgi:hypothetical protein
MPTPIWADFFKTFDFAFTKDPLARTLQTKDVVGAGIIQPDSIPSLSPDGSFWSNSDSRLIRLRETNDFIDLSTVTNRQSRYKEYERLRNIPEIEMALNVFSDESCLAGNTLIATPFGMIPIKELAEKQANDKFLVYCWDFKKQDYTLGWAHSPRMTKVAKTQILVLDDGTSLETTTDHRILMRDGSWRQAGEINEDDELMPFYRLPASQYLTKIPTKQYPRIFTFQKGWMHERQFVDEWRTGKSNIKLDRINQYARLIASGMTMHQITNMVDCDWKTVKNRLRAEGFTLDELRVISRKKDRRRVVSKLEGSVKEVFDLSVEDHQNFCTNSAVVHNCQKNDKGHILTIECKNDDVREELEFLFFHKSMINIDRRAWADFKSLLLYGDLFYEIIIDLDSPKNGVMRISRLPPESIYRIETTKGRVVEFQQSKEGPDYQSLTRAPVTQATEQDIMMATAIRFSPEQIIHARIGDDRKTFYPYGVSMVEAARGPAHQLRLMEDAMLVYRLSRSPERRVFYIDVGQLPPFKAEAFVEKLKDQFRKKKISSNRAGMQGPNSVEERYHAPAVDEDYWLPIRPNSNTKIETLPGAQNLGEIDDAVYFRNRLFTALQFPKNYFNVEDAAVTRITLSAQDIRVARLIERLQAPFEDAMWEVADRHLKLRGFPLDSYDDLQVRMTPPSEWRELSRAEIVTARIQNATGLKSAAIMGDYDILTKWMGYTDEDAKLIMARAKMQKIEDAKLQILSQNPALLGVGIPAPSEEDAEEIGTTPEGPNPMLSPPGETPPETEPSPTGEAPTPEAGSTETLPIPNSADIQKYDLEIQDYANEEDIESPDYDDYE